MAWSLPTNTATCPSELRRCMRERVGKVFAAPATWARLVRERGWLRPRKRLYPDKPTEGIQASGPGEILHIDVTIIKLVDGTKT